MRIKWFIIVVILLFICTETSCSFMPDDEPFDRGISLIGAKGNFLIYNDHRYSLEVSIPYDSKLYFRFEPPDMESAYEGRTTPDRYINIYYEYEGNDLNRNVISICAMNVPHTYNWGYDKSAEEYEFITDSGSKGKMRKKNSEDSIELHAIYDKNGHFVDVYFSKEAYSEAEELIMTIIKSVKACD